MTNYMMTSLGYISELDPLMQWLKKTGGPFSFYPKENVIPPIEKIIFNPPATIVFWDDGEKTVVKCKESEEFDYECGLAFAIAKRYFGSRSEFKKAIGKAKKIISDPDPEVKSTERDMNGFKRKNAARSNSSDITSSEVRLTNSYIDERLRKLFLNEFSIRSDTHVFIKEIDSENS